MAAPKKKATLLTGPPMSKAIIEPRIMPSKTWLPEFIASSQCWMGP